MTRANPPARVPPTREAEMSEESDLPLSVKEKLPDDYVLLTVGDLKRRGNGWHLIRICYHLKDSKWFVSSTTEVDEE